MQLNEFMETSFPSLQLRPALFYSWDIGIRFELGTEWKREYDFPGNRYSLECYKRAITLFEALHSPEDEMFVVIDVIDFDKGKTLRRKLKNFSPYVDSSLLYRLKHQVIPPFSRDEDEEERYKIHRFSLKCQTADLNVKPLIRAISNMDLGIKPSMDHRVYFINMNKKTVFHVYDDRGCDLLAASSDTIRDLYKRYNDWILDYDRPEIDKVFNGSL